MTRNDNRGYKYSSWQHTLMVLCANWLVLPWLLSGRVLDSFRFEPIEMQASLCSLLSATMCFALLCQTAVLVPSGLSSSIRLETLPAVGRSGLNPYRAAFVGTIQTAQIRMLPSAHDVTCLVVRHSTTIAQEIQRK
jgi:hypothetical protein